MKIKLFLQILLVIFCVAIPASRAEEMSAWEMWKAGYEIYGEAEQAKLAKRNSDALSGFQKARDYFQKIKKMQPNWNQKIIDQRISMCERQISKLLKTMNPDAASGSMPDPRVPDKSYQPRISSLPSTKIEEDDDIYRPGKTPISRRSYTRKPVAVDRSLESDVYRPSRSSSSTAAELESYRKKYIAAQLELEDLKKKLARSARTVKQVESIIREKTFLEEQYNRLLSKYDKLRTQGGASSEEVRELRNRLLEEKMKSSSIEKKLKMEVGKASENDKELNALRRFRTASRLTLESNAKQLKELQAKIGGLTDLIKTAKRDKRANEVKMAAMKYSLEQSEKRLAESQSMVEKLVKSIKNNKSGGSGKVDLVLAAENRKMAQELRELRKHNDSMVKELGELKAGLRAAAISETSLKDTISTLKTRSAALEKEYRKQLKGMPSSDASLLDRKKITQLEKKNRELEEELRRFASRMKNIRDGSDVSDQYKDIIARLNKRLSELNDRIIAKENDYSRLEARLKKATIDNSALTTKLTKLESDNADMQQEIKIIDLLKKDLKRALTEKITLEKQVKQGASLKKDYEKILKEYKRVQHKMLSSEGEVLKLQDEMGKLRRDIADYPEMKKKLAAANAQLKKPPKESLLALKKQIEAQKKEVLGLQKSMIEYNRLKYELTNLKNYAADLTIAEKQLAVVRKQLIGASKKLAASDRQNALLKKRYDVLLAKYNSIDKSRGNVTFPVAGDKESDALRKQVTALKAEVNGLKNKLATKPAVADARVGNLEKENALLKQQVAKLQKVKTKTVAPVAASDVRKKFNYLFAEAVAAAGKGDLKTSEWHYRQALKLIPGDPHASSGLAKVLLLSGRGAEAFPLVSAAIDKLPPSVELYVNAANAAGAAGHGDKAVSLAESAYKLDDNSGPAIDAMVNALLHAKQHDKAEQVIEDAEKTMAGSPYVELAKARLSLLKGPAFKLKTIELYSSARKGGVPEDPELEKFLKKVKPAKSKSDNISFLRQSAADAVVKKDYDSAVWFSRQMVEKSGKSAEILNEHAAYCLLAGKTDDALRALDKARSVEENNALTMQLVAAAKIRQGKFSDAVKDLREAKLLLTKNKQQAVDSAAIRAINSGSIELAKGNIKSAKPDKYAPAVVQFISNLSAK